MKADSSTIGKTPAAGRPRDPRIDASILRAAAEGEKIQAGRGNENGDVEQRHHRFKRAVDQELMLRGSRDFTSVDEYRRFLQMLFLRLNAGRRQRLIEEMAVMRELPERRIESIKRERVRVDSGSLIYVDRDADLNAPATTPSGCVDGMVISQVIGRGAPELVRFWGEPPLVREPDVALFGFERLRADLRVVIDGPSTASAGSTHREIGTGSVV